MIATDRYPLRVNYNQLKSGINFLRHHRWGSYCMRQQRALRGHELKLYCLHESSKPSCNPSMGGVGKGTLVREVDAMDGLCGRISGTRPCPLTCHRQGRNSVSDSESLKRRCSLCTQRVSGQLDARLNTNIEDSRTQIDRKLYNRRMRETLFDYPNLEVRVGGACHLVLDHTAGPNSA